MVPTERMAEVNTPTSPRFAVRISRGLVTHLNDAPLAAYEQAEEARRIIEEQTGERGEIEQVLVAAQARPEGFFTPVPGNPDDACPNCGIHRQHAGNPEACGEGYAQPGCFAGAVA